MGNSDHPLHAFDAQQRNDALGEGAEPLTVTFPVGTEVRVQVEFPTLELTFDAIGIVIRRGGEYAVVQFKPQQQWLGRPIYRQVVNTAWMTEAPQRADAGSEAGE